MIGERRERDGPALGIGMDGMKKEGREEEEEFKVEMKERLSS